MVAGSYLPTLQKGGNASSKLDIQIRRPGWACLGILTLTSIAQLHVDKGGLPNLKEASKLVWNDPDWTPAGFKPQPKVLLLQSTRCDVLCVEPLACCTGGKPERDSICGDVSPVPSAPSPVS